MKEMLDYYATGPASEIDSSARFDFDIWNLIENWRRILGIAGNRLLDVGGGLGKFSAMAIRKGFDVTMVDISRDIIQRAVALHPELKDRVYILDIFNPQNVTDFIRKHGQFDIILSLGFVVNHTDSPEKILCALDNHLKLAKANSLLVIDIEVCEMWRNRPILTWCDFWCALLPLEKLGWWLSTRGLHVLDVHSLHYKYISGAEDHGVRLFIHKSW